MLVQLSGRTTQALRVLKAPRGLECAATWGLFELAHGPRVGMAAMVHCLIARIDHSMEEKILDKEKKYPRVSLTELPKSL